MDTASEQRICVVCGAALVRRANEEPCDFRKRKTCNRQCGHVLSGQMKHEKESLLPNRQCIVCDRVLVRREDEQAHGFKRRKTCGGDCFRIQRGRSRKRMHEVRLCLGCGKPLSQRDNEDGHAFAQRKTCDRTCGAKIRPKAELHGTCEICGKTFKPRFDENVTDFKRRQTCGKVCGAEQKRRARLTWDPSQPKTCGVCGVLFTQRPNELQASFRKRKTCSKACKAESQRILLQSGLSAKMNASPRPVLDMSGRETRIETATYEVLDRLGIVYQKQRWLNGYRVDVYIPSMNTIIEVNGEYWHVSPRMFPDESKLRPDQIEKRRYDAERLASFARQGYRIIILWEFDIRDHGAETLLRKALGILDSEGIAA